MLLRRYHDENGRGEGVTTVGDVNPDTEQAAEPKRKRSAKSDDKSGD